MRRALAWAVIACLVGAGAEDRPEAKYFEKEDETRIVIPLGRLVQAKKSNFTLNATLVLMGPGENPNRWSGLFSVEVKRPVDTPMVFPRLPVLEIPMRDATNHELLKDPIRLKGTSGPSMVLEPTIHDSDNEETLMILARPSDIIAIDQARGKLKLGGIDCVIPKAALKRMRQGITTALELME